MTDKKIFDKKFVISLDEKTHKKIKNIAREMQISMNQVIRMGCKSIIKKYEEKIKKNNNKIY